MIRSRLLFLALTLALLAVTACGGASDSTVRRRLDRQGLEVPLAGRLLDPAGRLRRDHPRRSRRPATARASGFKSSFGASGEQSRAVEAGLKADVVSFSTEPDMTRLVDAGLVGKRLEQPRPNKGLVTTSRRLLHRPQGQPEEHQDVGRPAQAGRQGPHAEPVHVGRRQVEPAGRLRRQERRRQEPRGRARLPERADHQARQGPGQVGPRGAADVHLRHRRRAALLRVRGHHRPKKGEERRLRDPGRHDQDRHRHRRHRRRRAAAGAEVPRLRALASRRRSAFADWGYRPVNQEVFDANKSKFPDPAGLFTIDDLGGWPKVNDELFDPEKGSVAKIEEDAGVSTA